MTGTKTTATKAKRNRRWWRELRDVIGLWLIRVFVRVVENLPLTLVQRIGDLVGNLIYLIPNRRERRIDEHLAIAFPPPDYDESFRRKVKKESCKSTVKMGLETVWVGGWKKEKDHDRVTIATPENWNETFRLAKELNRGVVLLLAHHGCTELMMRWFSDQTGLEIMGIAGRAKSSGYTEEMTRLRQRGGGRVVIRGEAGFAAMKHLKKGGAVGIFGDHNVKGHGVSIPFFGKEAHTLIGPARMILATGAIAITIFPIRGDRHGEFIVKCGKPIVPEPPAKDREERFRQECRLTKEYVNRVEEAIRENPGQYLWMHRRWMKRSDTLPYPE